MKKWVLLCPYTKIYPNLWIGENKVCPTFFVVLFIYLFYSSGFLTPANNQKSCGSCYAYSIAHSISGQIYKRTGLLIPLSQQQLVDCSAIMGNHGCFGGSLRNTLRYLERSGGLMREQDYPYTASVSLASHF